MVGGEFGVSVLLKCGRNWIVVTEVFYPRVVSLARDIAASAAVRE